MERMLSVADVQERTSQGRTTLWRGVKAGTFPAPRRVVGNRIGWLESEVDEWIRSRPIAGSVDATDEAA